MRLIIALLLSLPLLTIAQTDDYVSDELAQNQKPLIFKKIDTEFLNNDAWRSGWISTDAGRLKLYMPYSSENGWQEWHVEGDDFESMITTIYRNEHGWKEWEWQGRHKISIRTSFSTAQNPWKEWEIEMDNNPNERIILRCRFVTRDDAWTEWEIEHLDLKKGDMRVQTRYVSGDNIWQSWDIVDNMPDVEPELKAAALFVALFSATMRYSSPKAACTYNGIPLKGKVKIVDSGEDFKIRYVSYDADIRVKLVDWMADDCGEWQIVESGEDFKVKVVDWNEDLKVEKVQFTPGMK